MKDWIAGTGEQPAPFGKGGRLKLSKVSDDYILGIMCEKLGLVGVAKENLVWLKRVTGERTRLFKMGQADADLMSLWDIQDAMVKVYNAGEEVFLGCVKPSMRKEVLRIVTSPLPRYDNLDKVGGVQRTISILNEMSDEARMKRGGGAQ